MRHKETEILQKTKKYFFLMSRQWLPNKWTVLMVPVIF